MDFDLNATLNDTQAAVYAVDKRANQQAPSTLPIGIKRSVSPVSDTPVKRLAAYPALPTEVILQIADHLSLDDIPAFSLVNKRTYYLMEERRWAWRCYQQAAHVSDLTSLQQLIDDIERIQAEPDIRAEPLTALWQRSQSLGLSRVQKAKAFKKLFAAADRLPKQGLILQKRMLASLVYIMASQRSKVFNFAYAIAAQRQPDQENFWPELANALVFIWTPSQYFEKYEMVLCRLPYLNMSQKAELIPVLAKRLRSDHRVDPDGSKALSTYAVLQQQTLYLPPSQQGASVGALAAAIQELPEAARAVRYTEMRQLALSLSDEQLGVALRYLPVGLAELPREQHVHEFQLLEPALLRVLPTQRVQVAISLLGRTHRLDDALSKHVWQRALRLLDGSSTAELLRVFSETSYVLRTSKGQDAVNEITAFMDRNHFTGQTRTTVLEHLSRIRNAQGA
ncbi:MULTISPECIES: F-box protein [Mycetohabitans]|nr:MULTISPECIES: F-box protein [Mycetohabitans]MCF7695378.1 F-box protein [Mycetohabitans sp. B2]MCG1046649.1 F-box protein [Mycetohabitans sp. B6]